MPRPGPRPYECVRRAWHSDRHRPMRGSIIQQIFRVVNEAHGAATKKNREWQEKLPIVVFKAEEIMYSKANSEVEYLNPETLWDRVNDAVNTIIRRDESTETGELLPPCVEAALNLGCVPVRASRSERHSTPRSYLSPRAPEPASTPPRVFDNTADKRPQSSPLQSSNQLNFPRTMTTMNSTRPVTEHTSHFIGNSNIATPSNQLNFPRTMTTMNSTRPVTEHTSHVIGNSNIATPSNYPFRYDNVPPQDPVSVYPLYYGTNHQAEESCVVPTIPENTKPNTIFFGTPICTSVLDPAEMGIRDLLSGTGARSATSRPTQANNRETFQILPEKECNLSLQLGLSDAYSSVEKSLASMTENASTTSHECGELSDPSRQRNKEFCFFPRKLADGSSDSNPKRLFPEDVDLNLGTSAGKRKSPFS